MIKKNSHSTECLSTHSFSNVILIPHRSPQSLEEMDDNEIVSSPFADGRTEVKLRFGFKPRLRNVAKMIQLMKEEPKLECRSGYL